MGATVAPARMASGIIAATPTPARGRAKPTVSSATERSSRACSGRSGLRAPLIRPEIPEPAANMPSSSPPTAASPSSRAKATMAMSIPMSIPMANTIATRVRVSGRRMIRSGGAADAERGPGSVPCCSASPRAPIPSRTAEASRPAAGSTRVTSAVTRVNTNSSIAASSASAAGSRALPVSSALHRARTQVPTGGRQPPATAAARNHSGRGAPARTTASSAATPSRCPASPASSTLAWPKRSRARPTRGTHTASLSAPAAATAPPTAYEPARSWTTSTVPSACIAIGSRPTNAGTMNRAAPGVASVRR